MFWPRMLFILGLRLISHPRKAFQVQDWKRWSYPWLGWGSRSVVDWSTCQACLLPWLRIRRSRTPRHHPPKRDPHIRCRTFACRLIPSRIQRWFLIKLLYSISMFKFWNKNWIICNLLQCRVWLIKIQPTNCNPIIFKIQPIKKENKTRYRFIIFLIHIDVGAHKIIFLLW